MPDWVLTLEPPAALSGQSNGGMLGLVWPWIWTFADVSKISKLGPVEKLGSKLELDTTKFCQFLSKVAYCSTIAQYGIESFTSPLPSLILSGSPLICDHVGGTDEEIYFDRSGLHSISVLNDDGYIKVYISLLASYGGPKYEIVVGRFGLPGLGRPLQSFI